MYLHLGRSYLVTRLDLEGRTVVVEDFSGGFYTQAKTDKNVLVAGQADMRKLPGAALFFGELEVTEQVIAYQKRDLTDGHVLDNVSLSLPEQTFVTQAFWLAVPQAVADTSVAALAETDELALPGALHAAEHATIALLPLYAMCDRWDIGGLSIVAPWHTDTPSFFVPDGFPGGVGVTNAATSPREPRSDARPSSSSVPASPAAPRACRAPSAATTTSRSASPAPSPCCPRCSG